MTVVAPQYKIRVDPADRTLESMSQFARRNPNELDVPSAKRQKLSSNGLLQGVTMTAVSGRAGADVNIVSEDEDDVSFGSHIIETSTHLRSIRKLRQAVEKKGSAGES
jgi:hypothetical protein